MLEKLRDKELSASMTKEAIIDQTSSMLSKSIPIVNAAKLQLQVKKVNELDLSLHQVRKVLKTDLSMTYRLAKTVPI